MYTIELVGLHHAPHSTESMWHTDDKNNSGEGFDVIAHLAEL